MTCEFTTSICFDLLQACLEDPQGASATFTDQQQPDGVTDGPAVYPLLLASLQEGHLEAAQLLLLAQLLHQNATKPQQTTAGTAPSAASADLPNPPSLTRDAVASAADGAAPSSTSSTTTSSRSSSSGGHSLSPVVWPPMVLNRLALLAAAGSSSSSNDAGKSTAGRNLM